MTCKLAFWPIRSSSPSPKWTIERLQASDALAAHNPQKAGQDSSTQSSDGGAAGWLELKMLTKADDVYQRDAQWDVTISSPGTADR
jgi:hypothetical protein